MVPPVSPCDPDEVSMVEYRREGGIGSIKTHCGVSGVGHSPAVGTPKPGGGTKTLL